MNELTETERTILIEMLDDLANHMGNAGCNDYTLPDTDGGRKLAEDVEAFLCEDDKDRERHIPARLDTSDFAVLACLRKKLNLESR